MIYTVTLNPALDCFLRPDDFTPGRVCRYDSARFLLGGKGINVSLLLMGLGVPTAAAGIAAGFTGRELTALLERAGCPADFVMLDRGHTRINIKILPKGGPETALNGVGPHVRPEDLRPLEEKLGGLREGDFLVLSGSVPGPLPSDSYARLMRAAPGGVETVADASGTVLTAALCERPFLIKPNLEELGEIFGLELKGAEDAVPYGKRLQEMGARNVAVTLGGGGALLLTEDGRVLERAALPGREVSSVGAGDSFVGGFLYGWQRHRDMDRAFDWAVCAGAATAFCEGIADGAEVKKLYEKHFLIEI